MAKTRNDLKTRIYEYLPQINHSSKVTLVEDSINLALEELSTSHDFRWLRSMTPDTATMTAGQYYVDLTSFGTIGNSASCFLDITALCLMESGSEDYHFVKYLDDKEFHHRYGYVDYTSRTRGDPVHYTRLEDRLIFNCPVKETKTLRAWYKKHMPRLTADTGAGSTLGFPEKDTMVGFQAVLYLTLCELKNSLNSVEFPQELSECNTLAQAYTARLAARDADVSNEDTDLLSWGERSSIPLSTNDPYRWV